MTLGARVKIAAAGLVLTGSIAVGPAGYAAPPGGPTGGASDASVTSMYLDNTDAQVAGVGADQCGLPLDQRTGPWVCPGTDAGQPDPTAPSSGGISGDGVAAPAGTAYGWCISTSGGADACWDVAENQLTSDSSGASLFGYGYTAFGHAKMNQNYSLNGAQMATWTNFRSTSSAVSSLTAQCDLLRGGTSTEGSPVGGQKQQVSKASLAAGTNWHPKWKNNSDYCYTYDTDYTNHAAVIQYTWHVPGYPGTWWCFEKSVIAQDRDNNNKYLFNENSLVFKQSYASGWIS